MRTRHATETTPRPQVQWASNKDPQLDQDHFVACASPRCALKASEMNMDLDLNPVEF